MKHTAGELPDLVLADAEYEPLCKSPWIQNVYQDVDQSL